MIRRSGGFCIREYGYKSSGKTNILYIGQGVSEREREKDRMATPHPKRLVTPLAPESHIPEGEEP